MCIMHISHTVTLIETHKPRQMMKHETKTNQCKLEGNQRSLFHNTKGHSTLIPQAL
jgi:hypothetical protein